MISGCASKIQPSNSEASLSCRGAAGFTAQTSTERIRGSLRFKVSKVGKKTIVQIALLNPLGLTEALVNMDSSGGSQILSNGKKLKLKDLPLFESWFSKHIFEELWFISDQSSEVNEAYIQALSEERSRYLRNSRMIQCENRSQDSQEKPKRSVRDCHLKDPKIELKLNFSSLSC